MVLIDFHPCQQLLEETQITFESHHCQAPPERHEVSANTAGATNVTFDAQLCVVVRWCDGVMLNFTAKDGADCLHPVCGA